MLPVVWLDEARDELDAIAAFVAEWDVDAAIRLMEQIEYVAVSLTQFPYRGHPGRVAGTRELLAHPNYWVIYEVKSDRIEISTILHARREYP